MGGAHETMIAQKVETPTGEVVQVGDVRIHVSDKDPSIIDFHDDKNGRKVSVLASIWDTEYHRLIKTAPDSKVFVDVERQTSLTVKMRLRPKKPKKGERQQLDVLMKIDPVGRTTEFEHLHKFSTAAKS